MCPVTTGPLWRFSFKYSSASGLIVRSACIFHSPPLAFLYIELSRCELNSADMADATNANALNVSLSPPPLCLTQSSVTQHHYPSLSPLPPSENPGPLFSRLQPKRIEILVRKRRGSMRRTKKKKRSLKRKRRRRLKEGRYISVSGGF